MKGSPVYWIPMHRLSMVQALSIWSELEAAYYGKNGFGGDTAEIYMYRLMSRCPRAEDGRRQENPPGLIREGLEEQTRDANESLYALLKHFVDSTSHVLIKVNGRELGEWLKTAGCDHRVQVQVIRL